MLKKGNKNKNLIELAVFCFLLNVMYDYEDEYDCHDPE